MENGYVAAAGFSLYSAIEKRLKNYKNEQYALDIINQIIFKSSQKRVLFSFGHALSKKKNYTFNPKKYIESTVTTLKKLKSNYLTKDVKLYMDSGGFQCAMGYLSKNELKTFVDTYYEFLNKHSDLYDYAFSLDLPPADGLYDTWDDMYDYNYYSYNKIIGESKEEVQKKIIFVKQFRTPSQYYVWNKLLEDDKIKNGFKSNYWSVGGIVANLAGETAIPYITYCIPFNDIFIWCKENKMNEITIHVLGGCGYRDLFFYELTRKYMELKYNFKVNFTYDSSGLVKQILMGRFINTFMEDGTIGKISFTSNLLDKIVYKNLTTEQVLFEKFKEMLNYYNIDYDKLPETIYKDNKLHPFSEALLIIYQLYTFDRLKNDYAEYLKDITIDIFDDEDNFNEFIWPKLLKINGGRVTVKFKNKAHNFWRSIQHLNTDNPDKNKSMIDNYMSQDEIKFGTGDILETF